MNAAVVGRVANAVSRKVSQAFEQGAFPLVLGGDCTVEIGTVAGALRTGKSIGLIYFDLDADLNTPETTNHGALDWMGVAHMLGLPGARQDVIPGGYAGPMLNPGAVYLFALGNVTRPESRTIEALSIKSVSRDEVAAGPARGCREVQEWATAFDLVLVHFDVDVIDFEDFPIAENVRRKVGLSLATAMQALERLLAIEQVGALTVCEVNPDHGQSDGSTLQEFVQVLADAMQALNARQIS